MGVVLGTIAREMLLAITRKVPGPVFGRNRTYVDMAARCSKALARSLGCTYSARFAQYAQRIEKK